MGRRKGRSRGPDGIRNGEAEGLPARPAALPPALADRLRLIFPAPCIDAVLESFSAIRPVGVRVNPLRGTIAGFMEWAAAEGISLDPVPGQPTGFVVPHSQRERMTHSPLVDSGQVYLQGVSSQYAAPLLGVAPGQTVLDLAAAPGGKTTHLAALMENRGKLAAVEPVRDRFFRLRANLERMGVTIARTYLADGRSVGRKTGERFDRVMLDAPCSSEARIRLTEPDSLRIWSLRKVAECSRKQAALIVSAFDALLPGGQLLYCTCSFAPEENERIVTRLLQERPYRAELIDLPELAVDALPGLESFQSEQFASEVKLARRIIPGPGWEGFFFALIRKRGGSGG